MITRRDLRRSVAHMLDDYALATDATGGQTNQLTDKTTLARESGYFQGMQLYFCNPDSPSYGHIATVQKSDWATRTIYFEPPLAVASIPGEEVEMYNFKGRGSTKNQYDHSIADAVTVAREQHALIPMVVNATDPFSASSPRITVPDDLVSFSYLQFTLPDGNVYDVAPRNMRVDRTTRTVTVTGSVGYWLRNRPFAFVGYGLQAIPQSDDDVIRINAEWMMNETKAQILERMIAAGRPVGSQDRLYLQERMEASGKRPLTVTRVPPNTIRF